MARVPAQVAGDGLQHSRAAMSVRRVPDMHRRSDRRAHARSRTADRLLVVVFRPESLRQHAMSALQMPQIQRDLRLEQDEQKIRTRPPVTTR